MLGKTHTQGPSYSSLRTSLFFQTFVLLTLAIVISTAAAFALSWNELWSRSVAQLESIADAKVGVLETSIATQKEAISLYGRSPASLPELGGNIGYAYFPQSGDSEILEGQVSLQKIEESLPNNFRTQAQTRFIPMISDAEWTEYLVTAPVYSDGEQEGVIVAVFDVSILASVLNDVQSLGETAELLLVIPRTSSSLVLRGQGSELRIASLTAGEEPLIQSALRNQGTILEGSDYAGISVVASSRTLPSQGWVLMTKVDRFEFMRPLLRLGINIIGIGFLLVVLLSLSTFFMSKRIVLPLEDLSRKLQGLETKNWQYEKSIHTGNELELVDTSAFDLTQRLRTAYDHLEDLVAERTQELDTELAAKAAILASMADGLVVTDSAGAVTYANGAAEEILGVKPEEMKDRYAHEVIQIVDAHGTQINHKEHPIYITLNQCASYAPIKDPQLSVCRGESLHVAVSMLAAPIMRDGECIGSVLSFRDVTDARRIDILKSEFISLVSHQLRTPISSISWYLEMLEDEKGSLTDDQQEYVTQVNLANARMNHLVNALLNASRIELGKFQLSPTKVDIQDIIEKTQQSLQVQMEKKGVQLEASSIESLPGMNTDPSLLALIIDNLMSNAMKYSMEKSVVTISGKIDTEKNALLLAFTDKGIGIPAEQQKQIGQKLFRGTNARMSDTDGNGLGLYISKLAAEAIGARITFESEENQGTTFTLHLPLERSE